MNPNELRSLWENEHHWGYGPLGGYFCKQDPRLFVPKRRLPGGTLNLAHALAIPILTSILGFLILLVLAMSWSCGHLIR